jgi:hypothetical protein
LAENQEKNDVPDWLTDESTVKWMEEHLLEMKQSVSGPRLLYQSLVVGFVLGLAAHIGGYFLQLSASNRLLDLLADLLLALGWSLWTGVIVALFVEVIPEVKRRQFKQAIDAYEALRRNKAAGKRKRVIAPKTRGRQSRTPAASRTPARSSSKR